MIQMTTTTARIWVRFARHGLHRWPGAHDGRAYLRAVHRHLFHVEVSTDVTHDDREIEFHDLQERAAGMFETFLADMPEETSCEMMARWLASGLAKEHERPFTVSVSEDGECGATVTFEPGKP